MPARHTTQSSSLALPLLLLTVVGAIAGCGGGAYDERFQLSLKQVQDAAPFTALFSDPVPLEESPLLIRMPKELGADVFAFDPAQPLGKQPRAHRPPLSLIGVPGFLFNVRKPLSDENSNEYQLTASVFAFQTDDFLKTLAPLLKQLPGGAKVTTAADALELMSKAGRPQAKLAWEAAPCKTPTGGSVDWKKMELTGPQVFSYKQSGADNDVDRPLPGTMQLWLYESKVKGEPAVLVAWRYPDTIKDKVQLGSLPELTAGTIAFREVSQEPAEDAAKGPAKDGKAPAKAEG